MEPEAPGTWAYAAAFVVTIVCLALANVVIAYLGAWTDFDFGNRGVVTVSFVQGVAGALLAGFASRQLFRSLRPADFWLKWIVVVAAILFAVAITWAAVIGKAERALNWMTLAGVVSLFGTEMARRMMNVRERRSSEEGSAFPS